MITPNTNIRLLKVPFEIARKNQLTFANVEAQTTYFLSLPYLEYDNTTYQRQNNIIRFEAPIDDIRTYNYVMYKNESYSNKWFYAYITNMEYKNDNTTDITIQTDVFQTWQFNITYNRMFVEREHVNDDTIGKHTIPENLNVGEVKAENSSIADIDKKLYVAVQTDWKVISYANGSATGEQTGGISVYTKQVFGNYIYLFPLDIDGCTVLLKWIIATNVAGHPEDIKNMFILPLPDSVTKTPVTFTYDNYPQICYTIDFSLTPYNITYNYAQDVTTFSDITLKNNKCKVYPYNYLFVTNNVGGQNIFKIEDFSNISNIQFKYELALSVGGSGRLIPLNYKNIAENLDEAVPLGKFPTCSWTSDAYTNWLTKESVNMATRVMNVGVNAVQEGINMSSAAGNQQQVNISGAGNVASQIGGIIGDYYSASLLPNIQGGTNTGDVNFSSSDNDFRIYRMRAKKEYLQVIDNFFSMFGYKVNEVKVPNVTGRTNWNYVKTIDCNITGEIPQEDLQELKNIFDNGVTFWHNPSTFLDYSQNNAIVT